MARKLMVPGFGAIYSLYCTTNQYDATGVVNGDDRAIVPSLIRRPDTDCTPGCICVAPWDCPCCESLLF
jgi:hypothetical protein